jgi:DUF4097 and DUF4098 domain-containing protein YvlB
MRSLKEERRMILQMIEEGKITVDEGVALLEALERTRVKNEEATEQQAETNEESKVVQNQEDQNESGSSMEQELDEIRKLKKEKETGKEYSETYRRTPIVDIDLENLKHEIISKADKIRKEMSTQGRSMGTLLGELVEKIITKVKDIDFDFDFGNHIKVEREFTGTMPAGGIVELGTVNGSVKMIGWDRDEYRIEVKGWVRAENSTEAMVLLNECIHFDEDEEQLTLKINRRKGVKAALQVYLPDRLLKEIDVLTSNGSIHAEGLKIGDGKLETNNGSITLENCEGTNLLCVSSNGKIVMDGSNMNEVYVKTSNGAIRLSGIYNKVKCRSSNGGIRYVLKSPAEGNLDLKTTNGTIEVKVPSYEMKVQGELNTTFGSLECNLPNIEIVSAFKEVNQRTLRFQSTLEAGKTLDIACQTSNGAIRVYANED